MFGGYAYTYAVKGDVAMTSDQAAYLTSFYWVRLCWVGSLIYEGNNSLLILGDICATRSPLSLSMISATWAMASG